MPAAHGLVTIAVVRRVAALLVPAGFVDLIIAAGAVWPLGLLSLLGRPDDRNLRLFGEDDKVV